MKNKTLRYVLTAALAAAVMLCSVCMFAACGAENSIVELRIENAKTSFLRGDMFQTGELFAVYAVYKDGTEANVTDEATVRPESGIDMNTPGNYQITVKYRNKTEIYTIYVNDSEDVLRKLTLETSAVKKDYKLGDPVSLDGIVLRPTYETAQGVVYDDVTTSLKNFTVTITGENDEVVTDVFTALGEFTVTVSRGAVKASFTVNVSGINISSVQSALAVGGFYKNAVSDGETTVAGVRMSYAAPKPGAPESPIKAGDEFISSKFYYEFGDNYTYVKDDVYTIGGMGTSEYIPLVYQTREYHCSIDSEGFFMLYKEDDSIRANNVTNPDMMKGAPFLLWYSSVTEYGLESALNNLYAHASVCSNNDLKETVDEQSKEYSFSFSGLELRSNSSDYYETTVTFKLGAGNAVVSAKIVQDYYEYNGSLAEQEGYVPTFITDSQTGITTPNGDYTYRTVIYASQTEGERDAVNEYGRDMFKIQSYKLTCNGEVLQDNDVLYCDVAVGSYTLNIEDIEPTTALFEQDQMYFDYDGNYTGKSSWLSSEHFTLYRTDKTIYLTVYHDGEWTLWISTGKTLRKLVIHVTGVAPTVMNGMILNEASGGFYAADNKTLAINGTVHFFGEVNEYTDGGQTASVTSQNAQYADIRQVEIDGTTCFAFSASAEGVYTVRVASTADSSVYCDFTFTVSEAADYSQLLSGTYKVQDRAGVWYEVTFTQSGGDSVSGTVTVTQTPTDNDDNLLTDKAVTQQFAFGVDGLEIIVEHESGDKLWVEFAADENNNLILIDQRGDRYVLVPV